VSTDGGATLPTDAIAQFPGEATMHAVEVLDSLGPGGGLMGQAWHDAGAGV
jgi:hypothetical protein